MIGHSTPSFAAAAPASHSCRHQAHRRSVGQAGVSRVDPQILPRPCRVGKIIISAQGPSRADRGRVKAGRQSPREQ
jgi:hypothetical protein